MKNLMVLLLLVQHVLLLCLLQCPLIHVPTIHLLKLFTFLLKLFDATVIAHLLQVGFESLDAGSTIRETPNRGEAFGGEVQSIGVLVNRTEHMGKWVSDAR